jgi:hypothetical protein
MEPTNMKKIFKSLAAVALLTVAMGSLAIGLSGSAFAAGNPPWEPVANPPEAGSLTFYNAAGQQITGGSTTAQPFAAYVQGSTALHAGDTKATVLGYTPVDGQAPGAWSGEAISASTTYPNSSAPGTLGTSALPLVTGGSGDESIAQYVSDFPNSDTSSDGYAGLYVLRVKTSGTSAGVSTSYDSADIQVTGSTWSVVYPAPTLTSTSTSLGALPASPQVGGTSVTLTATVSPSAPGTVQFEYGTGTPTDIGSPVTVTGGTASISTTGLPVGTDSLSAVFTPAQFSAYSGSTGTASYTISPPPAAATNTALGVNPGTAAADTSVALTGTVTSGGNPVASGAGTVDFYDNGTSTADTVSGGTLLQAVPVGTGGVATLNYSSFAVGTHNIVAEFLPSNTAVYQTSLSSSVPFVATAPTYLPDAQTVEVGIPAGTLTITTPYTPSNPFQLGTASLNVGDSEFTASAAFGTPATDGPNGGITITDTRAGDLPWTASVETTNFVDGASDVINGQNLSFTGVTPSYISGNALQSPDVTTTDITSTPPGGTPYGASATGTDGLGGEQHQFASATAGDGQVYINGLLTLTAPTSTPAGTYTATLTFTIS